MTDKRFIAHVATEIVVLFGIVFFFFRQKQVLERRVSELENAVIQMQKTLMSMSRAKATPPAKYFPKQEPVLVEKVNEVPFEELILSTDNIDEEIVEELSELLSEKDRVAEN